MDETVFGQLKQKDVLLIQSAGNISNRDLHRKQENTDELIRTVRIPLHPVRGHTTPLAHRRSW